MKAYVTQYNPRHNFAALQGQVEDVVFLTEHEYMPLPLPSHDGNKDIVKSIYASLKDFNPTGDFLVPVGSPISIGVAFAALDNCGVNEFNVLKWNNQSNRYDIVQVFTK